MSLKGDGSWLAAFTWFNVPHREHLTWSSVNSPVRASSLLQLPHLNSFNICKVLFHHGAIVRIE